MLYPDGKDSSICISKGFDFYAIVYKNHGGGGKNHGKVSVTAMFCPC